MIIVQLQGGLGNQMFQYASGYSLAYENGVELKFDLSWFKALRGNVIRRYELDVFGINQCKPPWWWRIPVYFNMKNVSLMAGYWQSEKYFIRNERLIRNIFQFAIKPDNSVTTWINLIQSSNAISLHIRRGDYATEEKVTKYHGLLPLSYYNQAMKYMGSRVKKPTFFVFSDDLNWARKNLKNQWKMEFVEHTGRDFEDMRLMSLCKHHIIANSSFSWWGAWLNPRKNKIVIAPQNWYASGQSTQDLLPDDWTQL